KVPETWNMGPKGVSCISIVHFGCLLCKMIGLEGDVYPTAFYAMPANPPKAIPGGLGDHPALKKVDLETWQLFLVDLSNTQSGQVGGVGGMNFYEAVVDYEWHGLRYYYLGGGNSVYDSA